MRYLGLIGLLLCAAAGQAAAHNLPPCDYAAIPNLRQAEDYELVKHGNHEVGPVTEAFGSLKSFDFYIDYAIDEAGHVFCLSGAEPGLGNIPLIMTPERQAALDEVASWTFTPFVTDGAPGKVLAQAYVPEVERPAYHILRPAGDPAFVQITLENSGHRTGDGPFTMTIKGDGLVSFDGDPMLGSQTYHVPPEQVAAMLDLADQTDFWSLRDTYHARPFDDRPEFVDISQTYYRRVSITLGGRVKALRYFDFGYGGSGASEATQNLMAKMAELGGLELWRQHNEKTIAVLKTDGFDFKSENGGLLLMELAANRQVQDTLVREVMDLGAPTNLIDTNSVLGASFLDEIIDGRRLAMADSMIDHGALLKDGQPDPERVTRALAHAAASGLPELVAKLIAYHPVMTIRSSVHGMAMSPAADANDGAQEVPIIALVGAYGYDVPAADLIAVTQQFLDAGQDINSKEGGEFEEDSVLTNAIGHDQLEFVTWLLSKGAVVRSRDLLLPSFDEDMTVLLLGSGVTPDEETLATLVDTAQRTEDSKVEAWLKTHGKWPGDQPEK